MEYQKSKIILHFALSFCILIFAFCILASKASAGGASLYLSPSSGTYTVGSTFPVTVKVNSGGEEINAAEGTLVFDTSKIKVVSISKSGSIFSLWTTEPTFSNSKGNIVFGGGAPSNFIGTSGAVIVIVFKAKANASVQVSFSSGSILAADGKGTNILANLNPGNYIIQPKVITLPPDEYISPIAPRGTPAAPVVSSSTHLEEEKWYSNNNPEFSWELPSDVTGVSLLLHKKPIVDPGSISDGLIKSKKFEEVEGGIWYFHIKFKNQYGWGKITHRKVLVALEAPIITDFSQVANIGDVLIIKGTSKYPNVTVAVFVKKEGEEPQAGDVKTDSKGNWFFIYNKSLEKGTYQVWAEITDSQGAKSNPTEKITLAAVLPTLLKFGRVAIDYLTIIITLIALIVVIFYVWQRIQVYRKRIKRETREAKRSVERAFETLHKKIQEQVEYFDKRKGLSKREKKIRDELQEALKISKEFITKEIKDIEKEL